MFIALALLHCKSYLLHRQKRKMLSSVHRGVFRTKLNICDSVFLQKKFMAYWCWLFLHKSSLVDVLLVSKYASGFRNSHPCSVEKAVLKHDFANFLAFELNTSISLYYLSVFSLNVGKKLKKKLWLILFFVAVATYCSYEKVHWMMDTAIMLHVFDRCTFKIKSNRKTFLIFKNGTRTPKPLFLIKLHC